MTTRFGLLAIYPPRVTVIALVNILGVETVAVLIRSRRAIRCLKTPKFNFRGLEKFSVECQALVLLYCSH